MSRNKWFALAGLLLVFSMLLSACGPTPAAPVTPGAGETPVVEETPSGDTTPTEPAPVDDEEKTLVICMGQEPNSLYIHGTDMTVAGHVQEALYDANGGYGYDNLTYQYQPVIFEKMPNLNDGDAVINRVQVEAGDRIVSATGDPVDLEEGMRIRPAGCLKPDCEVEFDGAPLEMDQMVVTFTIKAGVTWSDGTPLTADDSVYGFELQGDPDTPAASRYAIERTTAYVAADDRTNVWTGLPGFIDSTYFTEFFRPLPRHLYQTQLSYSAADLVSAEESSRMPLAYGPFMIQEWVAGDHITMVKNPYYYRTSEGLPKVDTLIFRFIADSNAVLAQLISGECDLATTDTALEDQVPFLLQAEEQGIVIPMFVTGTLWEHVDFAINALEEYDRPNFFGDVRFRQAFAYCLNRQEVVDTVLYGRSIVLNNYIPPEHPLYAEDRLTVYPYDPEKGKALLEEIGWKDTDGDGVREANGVEGISDGTVLEFNWSSTTASMRVQYMQLYQQHLAECGMKVNLENMAASEFFAAAPEGALKSRRYDVASSAWATSVEPACNLYLSSEVMTEENGWAGQNQTGYSNAEYDAACNLALQSLPGSEDYVEGHKEAQRIYTEELPSLPLFLRLKLGARRPNVEGYIIDPTQNSELWNIENFDLIP